MPTEQEADFSGSLTLVTEPQTLTWGNVPLTDRQTIVTIKADGTTWLHTSRNTINLDFIRQRVIEGIPCQQDTEMLLETVDKLIQLIKEQR
jgi:hypothetical protein